MRRGAVLLIVGLVVALGILAGRIWLQAAPAVPAVLAPTPSQLAFGDIYVGTVATATATWKGTTSAAATATGLAVQGPNAPQFTWTAAAPLANVPVTSSQATPVLTFSFAPVGEGLHQAIAQLQSSTAVSVPLGLAGSGRFQINTGDLAFLGGGNLNPGRALDFGRMQVGGAPKTRQFRVANVGAAAVQVTRVQLAMNNAGFTHTAPAVPFVVQPLQGVMVTLGFNAPAFTRPPNQTRFTDGVTVHGQTAGNPAVLHTFGTALCGVGFYPAEEPELKC